MERWHNHHHHHRPTLATNAKTVKPSALFGACFSVGYFECLNRISLSLPSNPHVDIGVELVNISMKNV